MGLLSKIDPGLSWTSYIILALIVTIATFTFFAVFNGMPSEGIIDEIRSAGVLVIDGNEMNLTLLRITDHDGALELVRQECPVGGPATYRIDGRNQIFDRTWAMIKCSAVGEPVDEKYTINEILYHHGYAEIDTTHCYTSGFEDGRYYGGWARNECGGR